jgi:hypothetical protein
LHGWEKFVDGVLEMEGGARAGSSQCK